MEQKYTNQPMLLALGGGAAGFFLYLFVLTRAMDQGRLVRGSVSFVLLWALALLCLAGLALLCRGAGSDGGYRQNFPASPAAAGGAFLAAAALAVSAVVGLLPAPDFVALIANLLALAAAFSLVMLGFARAAGKKPAILFPLLVTLFLAARLVSDFRGWSADPQLGDYCFQLMASVFLMLASYYLAGSSLQKCRRRMTLFFSLGAVMFCLIALAGGSFADRLYYAGMAVWMMTGTCSLRRQPVRRRSAPAD